MSDSELRTTDSTSNVCNVCGMFAYPFFSRPSRPPLPNASRFICTLGTARLTWLRSGLPAAPLHYLKSDGTPALVSSSSESRYLHFKQTTHSTPLHIAHTMDVWTWSCAGLSRTSGHATDASDLMPTVRRCWTLRDNAVQVFVSTSSRSTTTTLQRPKMCLRLVQCRKSVCTSVPGLGMAMCRFLPVLYLYMQMRALWVRM